MLFFSKETSINDYQLLGDSHFMRMGNTILNGQITTEGEYHFSFNFLYSYKINICIESFIFAEGLRHIGLSVSGQTIKQLHERIANKFYPLGKKIVLMIGTNDFMKVNHFILVIINLHII